MQFFPNCDFANIRVSAPFFDAFPQDQRYNVINHEVGHALGLGDPDCNASDGTCEKRYDAEHCWSHNPLPDIDFDGDTVGDVPDKVPVVSIMHASGYCCPDEGGASCADQWLADPPYPTQYDFDEVRNIGAGVD